MKKKVVIAVAGNLDKLSKMHVDTIIRAFKIVRKNGAPPVYSGGYAGGRAGLRYRVGHSVIERNYDSNPYQSCGAGLNVATMAWCRRRCYRDAATFRAGDRLITVEFRSSDIVAMPVSGAGKFRVKRLKVVKSVRVTWRKR